MEVEPQKTGSTELLEYHRQIRRHIDLLQKIVTNLDVVDMAYRMWDWVEKVGVRDPDRCTKLAELLRAFEDMIKKHWSWEESVLFPEFDIRGATKFTARLLEDHQDFRRAFDHLMEKVNSLAELNGEGAEKGLEDEIKEDLKDLLTKLERHALVEEDAFFMAEHNV